MLWLSHFLPWPPKGGLLQRSFYLLREISRYHEVHLIALRQRAHQQGSAEVEEALQNLGQYCHIHGTFDLPEDVIPQGRLLLAMRSLLPGPCYTIRWAKSRALRSAIRTAVADIKPDIVHFDTIALAQYVDVAGASLRVLNHHNIESEMMGRRAAQERNVLKRCYFRQEASRLRSYERIRSSEFAYQLVCSDLDARRLREIVPDAACHVIANGVDADHFRPAPQNIGSLPESLIFVGGLGWYPNAAAMRFFLRDVWPKLLERFPAATLRIVGRSPPPDLREAAERTSGVEVMGFVDEMRPLVHESAVYVCPIRDGGGTKLKMLDAMALGQAIVAHPIACEGLDVTPGREVLVADTPQQFVESIGLLFQDPSLRDALGRRAREHVVRNFDVRTIGKRYALLLSGTAA